MYNFVYTNWYWRTVYTILYIWSRIIPFRIPSTHLYPLSPVVVTAMTQAVPSRIVTLMMMIMMMSLLPRKMMGMKMMGMMMGMNGMAMRMSLMVALPVKMSMLCLMWTTSRRDSWWISPDWPVTLPIAMILPWVLSVSATVSFLSWNQSIPSRLYEFVYTNLFIPFCICCVYLNRWRLVYHPWLQESMLGHWCISLHHSFGGDVHWGKQQPWCACRALPHVQSPFGELQQERAFFKDHWHTHESNQGIKHSFKQPSAYQFKLFWEGYQDLCLLRHWLPCGSVGLQQLVPIQVSERSFSLCVQHWTQSRDGCNPDKPEDSYLVGPSYEPQGAFVAPWSGAFWMAISQSQKGFLYCPKLQGQVWQGDHFFVGGLSSRQVQCMSVYVYISISHS